MGLQNFGDYENWLGALVVGQLDDLDFGLSEDMKSLDVGGRHLGSHGIQHGLYEDDEEEYKFDDFWTTTIVQWTPSVYVSTQVNLIEKLNLTFFWAFKQNTLFSSLLVENCIC